MIAARLTAAAAALAAAAGPAHAAPPRAAPVAPPRAAVRAPWAAGPLRERDVVIAFGLRLVRGQKPAQAAALVRKLAPRHLPGVPVVALRGKPPGRPVLGIGDGPADPLRPEELRYFGRGLDAATQARLARRCPSTGVVVFADGAGADGWLKRTTALVAEAATALGAVVEDAEARLYYSAAEFSEKVARDGFEGDLPIVPRHVALHTFEEDGGTFRTVTVGMAKLGLPDVVVNGHGGHGGPALQRLIQVVAQTLAERGRVDVAGRLDVDLRALRARPLREALLGTLEKNAKGRATIGIGVGHREGGDADNRLLELTFDGRPGAATERQEAAASELFGSKDEIVGARHDGAIAEESARERQRLLALKPAWLRGHDPGERLLVKAPFRTPDGGDEYMWIEVTGWSGTRIRGLLANDPVKIPSLRVGAAVEVDEGSVFDYLHRRADGTQEGNTTAKLLQR